MNLPPNGFRLRFDGADQRLRLIEVIDFTKTPLNYEDTDLVKLPEKPTFVPPGLSQGSAGPAFRHVYDRLFGPTFPGEYVPTSADTEATTGLYVLSYPGIAFNFPLRSDALSSEEDFVSVLSASAGSATTMAIFEGQSWHQARRDLMSRPCTNPRSLALLGRGREYRPDEIELIRIRGNGKLELERRSSSIFHIILGETTPQDLVAELGPPDAIHRKHDRRLSIHKNHRRNRKSGRTYSGTSATYYEDTTDTDQSSNNPITDDSENDEEIHATRRDYTSASAECFYNYFHHGFDVFVSYPTSPSPAIPSANNNLSDHIDDGSSTRLVAVKVLLHANIPGSYPFNRYRRSRWIIDTQSPTQDLVLDSESPFTVLSNSLQHIWRDGFANGSSKDSAQKAMVLNRDWGDSPGSSCEILGDWEESTGSKGKGTPGATINGTAGFGNTKLFGFPGLLFEVLKNDVVSCVTIY